MHSLTDLTPTQAEHLRRTEEKWAQACDLARTLPDALLDWPIGSRCLRLAVGDVRLVLDPANQCVVAESLAADEAASDLRRAGALDRGWDVLSVLRAVDRRRNSRKGFTREAVERTEAQEAVAPEPQAAAAVVEPGSVAAARAAGRAQADGPDRTDVDATPLVAVGPRRPQGQGAACGAGRVPPRGPAAERRPLRGLHQRPMHGADG